MRSRWPGLKSSTRSIAGTILEYARDLRDAERVLIAREETAGRPRRKDLRGVMEAVLYIVTTGCQWRQLPRHFPGFTTLQGYFYRWISEGRWEAMNDILVILSRGRANETLRWALLVASRLQPLKTVVHAVMTQAKRSGTASGISRPIRWVMSWRLSRFLPTFRVVTTGMLARRCMVRWLNSADGRSKSSSVAIGPKASSSNRNAGSWSAALLGSDAAAASRRMSRQQSRHPARG